MKTIFILLSLLYFWQALAAPVKAPVTKTNKCGRDVTGMDSYLDESFDLPLKSIARIVLAEGVYTAGHKKFYSNTKYKSLSESFFDISSTDWIDSFDGWKTRNVSFQRKVQDGNPLVSVATVVESHTAKYAKNMLILSKFVENLDAFTKGINIEGEYCAIRIGGRTQMQVHMKVVISGLLSLFSDSIDSSAKAGFIEVYGSLAHLLHHMEENKEYPMPELEYAQIEEELVLEIAEKTVEKAVEDDLSKYVVKPSPNANVPEVSEPKKENSIASVIFIIVIFIAVLIACYYGYHKYKSNNVQQEYTTRIALKTTSLE